MSDIERNKQRRLRFLRVVYDLADGTPSHGVRGVDVAERLDLDVGGEEFHAMAYYHEKADNTRALETNWGSIAITAQGIAEIESHATPASQGERRSRFLKIAYDVSTSEPVPFVGLPDVAEKMGLTIDEASQIAHYFGNRGLIKSESDGYGLFSLTSDGIDEAEGTKPQPQQAVSNVFNMSGNFYQAAVGTHNTNTFGGDLDFSTVERRIEEEGGADKEELRQLVAEMRELLQSGQTVDKGFLARFNDKLKQYDWLAGAVAGWLLNFSTQ